MTVAVCCSYNCCSVLQLWLLQCAAVINVAVCCSYRQGTKSEHVLVRTSKRADLQNPRAGVDVDDWLLRRGVVPQLYCLLVAVCCSVLQCVAVCCTSALLSARCSVLQCIEVCCSVLQCVAVCCSVLQCVVPQLYCLLVPITSPMSHVTHIHKLHHTKWTSHVTSLVGFLGFRGLGV